MGILKFLYVGLLVVMSLGKTAATCAMEIQVRPDQDPANLQKQARSLPPGSTIRFCSGRYPIPFRFSDVHGTAQAPIRIVADSGVTLEGACDPSANRFSNGSGILLEKVSDVIVEDFTISGYERGITIGSCQSVFVKRNKIHDVGNYGVMCYRSDGVRISENNIQRSYREHGIYVSASGAGIEVSDNDIRDTHVNGIHVNGAILKPIIINNHLERTGSFPSKEGGAGLTLVGGTAEAIVERNTFKDIYGQGITTNAPNAVISGNTFESCSWSAILGLPGALNMKISNNNFLNTKVIPLQLSAGILASLSASGDRFSESRPICQERESTRVYDLKQWRELGKDVR